MNETNIIFLVTSFSARCAIKPIFIDFYRLRNVFNRLKTRFSQFQKKHPHIVYIYFRDYSKSGKMKVRKIRKIRKIRKKFSGFSGFWIFFSGFRIFFSDFFFISILPYMISYINRKKYISKIVNIKLR